MLSIARGYDATNKAGISCERTEKRGGGFDDAQNSCKRINSRSITLCRESAIFVESTDCDMGGTFSYQWGGNQELAHPMCEALEYPYLEVSRKDHKIDLVLHFEGLE